MGKRRRRARQPSMWVASTDLPRSTGHPFYARLNRVLDEAGFDAFVEQQCAPFYADGVGRPSLAPGRYFRLLLLGYFEGLDSERAIAWRAADSLSLRAFLDVALQEAPPDHSTLSRTRRRIDVETHQAVFTWAVKRLAAAGLVSGKTVGIDATTLEANAALRSIVRRDSGESYETFLHGLAAASGIPTPTRAELARLDRKRPKKGSNADWTHPQDPDAKITKMNARGLISSARRRNQLARITCSVWNRESGRSLGNRSLPRPGSRSLACFAFGASFGAPKAYASMGGTAARPVASQNCRVNRPSAAPTRPS